MAISATAIARIWQGDGYRLFLSHKSEDKVEVGRLKKQFRKYGISAFVAHADIEPTQAWQNEIERALGSMDGLAALMTKNFHDSSWTDQEIGFALGRHVMVIAVNLGRNPYGFIGDMQALKTTWEKAAQGITKLLIRHDEAMFDHYVQAIRDCGSFDDGNLLSEMLPALSSLEDDQIQELSLHRVHRLDHCLLQNRTASPALIRMP
jgi:TIR domain